MFSPFLFLSLFFLIIGKKGKKSKGKKYSLHQFVQDPDGVSGGGVTQVQVPTKLSWAEECDDDDNERPMPTKIIELPTAPRAQRLMNDELVPRHPPYQVTLLNLPYDSEEADICDLFNNVPLTDIRLPRDEEGIKTRGYAYVEFEMREDLIEALSIPDPTIRNRRIKIDLPNENEQNRRDGRRNNRYNNDYNRGGAGGADSSSNWRDRQDAGGYNDGGDRRRGGGNNRGEYRNRDYQNAGPGEMGEPGSWRIGGGPSSYSPPPPPQNAGGDRSGRRQFPDRFREDRGGRGGGGRGRDFEHRAPSHGSTEDIPAERPRLNLQPRTLPLPELTFPKEEELEPAKAEAASAGAPPKENGDAHEDDDHHEDNDNDDDNGGNDQEHDNEKNRRNSEAKSENHDGSTGGEKENEEPRATSPKPRGVPNARIFGDAKPVDTAAKLREIEERMKQREQEAKQKAAAASASATAENDNVSVTTDDDVGTVTSEKSETDSVAQPPTQQQQQPLHQQEKSEPAPVSLRKEDSNSWRNRDADDNKPRRNYSPDGRGPQRRNGKNNLNFLLYFYKLFFFFF